MFYADGFTGINTFDGVAQSRATRAPSMAVEARSDVKELTRQVERLMLLNQAMWELIRERLHLTDAELEAIAQQVDMRDGIKDGKLTPIAVRCPGCGRVNNTRHKKCIYCSMEFESMVFE